MQLSMGRLPFSRIKNMLLVSAEDLHFFKREKNNKTRDSSASLILNS